MSDREINIPVELTESGMSLEEIGFVVVMYASPKMSKQVAYEWTNDEHFQKVGDVLESQNIINKLDGGKARIDIPERIFWRIEGYDNNENPSMVSDVPHHFNQTAFKWRVSPMLKNCEIFWKNQSDEDIWHNSHIQEFDSLDKAQEYFEILNIKILEELKKNGSNK